MHARRKGAIVIAGYYGYGNAGDELILGSLIHQLRRATPEVRITVLSGNPPATSEHYAVKAISRWQPWSWIAPLWNAELFILGGGGLLQESSGPWNNLYYLSLAVIAKLLGCRVEVRGIGVDPVEQGWNRIWTRCVFNYAVDFISVRDAESQRALETIGVYTQLWRVPDFIFQWDRPKTESPAPMSPRIAWAVAPWPQRPGWDHDIAFLLERVARQLNVSNDLIPFFPAQDEALSRQAVARVPAYASLRLWSQAEELLSWIPQYDLVIGMRYHALALAVRAGKPFIGAGSQRKVRTLCRDFQQPLWSFERGWDAESVFRLVQDSWQRRETLPERYKAQVASTTTPPVVASESARIFVPTR